MTREDNFRREPNGVVLGRLSPGAVIQVIRRQDNWLQVDVEGWIWLASLQASTADLDLAVSADGGENLRSTPSASGAVVGRLAKGALLEEVGRQPGWAHVKRRGWIWSASVSVSGGGGASSGGTVQAPAPSGRQPTGYARVGPGGVAVLASPDGDTLAMAAPARDLQVVSREGNWVRVRIDGWVWMPAGEQGGGALDSTPSALVPQDLALAPTAHVGRIVSWRLQFLSVERAEAIRTDFREGEPFLLTRYGEGEGLFVYVAIPSDRLVEVQGLAPLERIAVTARVRTGSSALTGAPVIDLLSFERIR